MSDELCDYSSRKLSRSYSDGSLSPVEVAKAALARIDRLNPRFNAFSFVDPDVALSMARDSEKRWHKKAPLGPGDGVPATIKDNMSVLGWPRRCGSLTIDESARSSFDSACVARMREAGCVFLGKTTTPEFAWKCVTDSPLNGVTRNPWNPALTPGGSSGGAAVAALLGMGVWHAASDAAGSIRVPAAFCGVQGFKPTFGIVPNYPASAFSGLGHHGPIAREVSDLAAMLSVIARPDGRDATAAPPHLLDFAIPLEEGIDGTRIGYVRGTTNINPEVAELIDRALGVFEGLGAAIEETTLELGDAREQIESYWRVGCALIVDSVPKNLRPLLDPGLMEKGKQGRKISATEFRAFELKRESLASNLHKTYDRFDLIVMPVVPIQPFPVEHDLPPNSPYEDWLDWTPLTYPFNLTQQPSAAVACGLTSSSLPTALQIVGPRFADISILRAAKAYELASARPQPTIT